MKAVYLLVRGVAFIFITFWKGLKFITHDQFVLIKQAFLRTKFWEQRILLGVAIAVSQLAVIGVPAIAACFVFPNQAAVYNKDNSKLIWHNEPNWDWLGLMGATGFSFVPFGFALYYANRKESNSMYGGSHRVRIEGEIDSDDVKWGAQVEMKKPKQITKTVVDEYDPDYRAGMREVEAALDEHSNFDKRLGRKQLKGRT